VQFVNKPVPGRSGCKNKEFIETFRKISHMSLLSNPAQEAALIACNNLGTARHSLLDIPCSPLSGEYKENTLK
jgi:hypothetical protein